MKTAMSWLSTSIAMQAYTAGRTVVVVDLELDPVKTFMSILKRSGIRSAILHDVIHSVRYAREVFRADVCVSTKYIVAEAARKIVRDARDAGIISFDCCMALQRALDY